MPANAPTLPLVACNTERYCGPDNFATRDEHPSHLLSGYGVLFSDYICQSRPYTANRAVNSLQVTTLSPVMFTN